MAKPRILVFLSQNRLEAIISITAGVLAALHLFVPGIRIDAIGLWLILIALLPWLVPFFQRFVVKGKVLGQEFEFRDLPRVLETAQHLLQPDEPDREGAIRQIAKSLSRAAETGAIGQLGGRRVLWVDDEPQNNEHGIKALQTQGVQVITCRTTQEALQQIARDTFDVIITDQLRYENGIRNDTAGNELVRKMRESGINVPVILSTAFPNRDEARRLGFYDATNTQHGIFELVMKAIQRA